MANQHATPALTMAKSADTSDSITETMPCGAPFSLDSPNVGVNVI